ncbi:MAG: hypothetical protein AAGD05_10955, partial [Bacteroidota bacterium]
MDSKESSGGATRILNLPVTYTFGKTAYSPQVSIPYRGNNFRGTLEIGANPAPLMGAGAKIGLSYIQQTLKHKNVWTKTPAYGYFHLKDLASKEQGLLDFNREKDGPIHKNTPNLANPISTPDVYSVMGQGVGGHYRPYRSNVGIFTDSYVDSKSGGGRFGIEVNPGTGIDVGAELESGNYAFSASGKWNIEGKLNRFRFEENNGETNFEPYYFKAGGELTAEPSNTYDYIGGEHAVRLKLDSDSRQNYDPTAVLEPTKGNELMITRGVRDARKPRANSIQPITNAQLAGENSEGVIEERLSEYKVDFYTVGENGIDNIYDKDYDQTLSREVMEKPHHLAGITALQATGMRYVYALPVKNKRQEEIVFSVNSASNNTDCKPRIHSGYKVTDNGNNVDHRWRANEDGTDAYINHTSLPEFTHAYLLTAILGADYIDLDEIEGPSDGDYGYWVKFNYIKTSDNYRWRDPFKGANYMPGKLSIDKDDKASVVYGSREQYYLATAETKTHIAEFLLAPRGDAKGALKRHQLTSAIDPSDEGASFKLSKIKLFSKLERFPNDTYNANAIPIKQIEFESEPLLCAGARNTTAEANAKLTLRAVKFTYENSTRGALSPYRFEYASNPDYEELFYDRWGTFRSMTNNLCDATDFPYTYQDQSKDLMDENAAAWHLNRIHLPSGATIKVDYEADDYAYVQDRTAMQMFKINKLGNGTTTNMVNTNSMEGIRNHSQEELEEEDLFVYFDLENPGDDIEEYLEDLHGAKRDENGNLDLSEAQLYYKVLIDVNRTESYEYISGYAKIATDNGSGGTAYGKVGGLGYIQLEPIEIGTP